MESSQADHVYRQFVAAIVAIANGKTNFSDTVVSPPFGQRIRLDRALSEASQLDEAISADHLELVEQARKVLGVDFRGNHVNEIAKTIFDILSARAKGQ